MHTLSNSPTGPEEIIAGPDSRFDCISPFAPSSFKYLWLFVWSSSWDLLGCSVLQHPHWYKQLRITKKGAISAEKLK
jgi:hypothetical protein